MTDYLPKGNYRGTNLQQHQAENWDRLADHAGMKPNALLRRLLEVLTDRDVEELLRR